MVYKQVSIITTMNGHLHLRSTRLNIYRASWSRIGFLQYFPDGEFACADGA